MPELLTTAAIEAPISVRSEPERIIDVRIVPWGTIGRTAEGPERIVRGAFRRSDPAAVTLEAIGPHGADPGVILAGRAIALENREDGQYGSFRVSRTRAGDELLELARDGVYRAASAVFEPVASRRAPDGVIERTAAVLVRVGLVERGAYEGAEVLAVRSDPIMETPQPVPDPTPDPVPDPEPTPDPPGARAGIVARTADNGAALDALRSEMFNRMTALEARGAVGRPHLLGRFGSFGEFVDHAYANPDDAPLLARVLADQITSESPGVMPPSWVTEIAGIIARPRPAIAALGGARSLGDSGMELDWPYLDPALDLDTVVAAQAAEKTEIASVKVKILKGLSPIATFAGGSDVSYQLIRRSRPAYREAYIRILAICYSRATEAAFEAALLAAAGESLVLTATATADEVRAFLFAASSLVDDATGSPATVDLVSPTEFNRLGGLAGLVPTPYGTQNVPGTATASTLAINVSGLPIVRAPFLTGNTHLVTNGEAAGFHEDGPFPISAEDVAKLGQNVAIWGMGATAAYVPAGIVKSVLVGTTRGQAKE